MELVAAGMKNKEIAAHLGRTELGLKFTLGLIYERLGMHNRVELALWYVNRTEGK